MTQDPRLEKLPKGRTCIGVHRAIIEYLLHKRADAASAAMLDIPCGDGELMNSLRTFFPEAVVRGGDLQRPQALTSDDFSAIDASQPFTVFPEQKFDFVFSVSGVMEFDNTRQFFETCREHLRDEGSLIVTNDNVVSIRDRLAYFWLGKVRPYPLLVTQGQSTWKMIPIHNLMRILEDAGFKVREVRYVSMKPKDWLMLPLALLVYPVQFLYLHLARSGMPRAQRQAMYPFGALLYRHYYMVCEKVLAARRQPTDVQGAQTISETGSLI